jgi:asparagine synthase (glutamine-hydrolysing)
MCGIVGSINCNFKKDYLSILAHRGPDGSGKLDYKNLQLGHLRLSILDTTNAGHQPMATENGNLVIIFNGEIYNHLELRQSLKKKGYSFKSGSDTETLLKGWDYWGKDVLEKLNGIFAFAILDKEKEKLFIVRDPFGIKPLYIYKKSNEIAFASELKVFEHLNNFDDTLEVKAFVEYLSFLWAPGEQTPYRHVRKLLPGHYVEIPLSRPSSNNEEQFYQLPYQGNYFTDKSETELVNELDHILRESVERQLLSDVPLGFFLSGGLDSSLLVGIARDLYPNTHFDCFTIASNMDKADEGFEDDLPYAKKVADDLNVDLHIIPADHNIVDQFDHMIWHLDEPQADPAPINVYNISKGARELGIKVLLGGTAGDDLFSGYRRHQALKYDQYLDIVPTQFRKLLKKGINLLPSNKPLSRRLQKLSRDWDKPLDKRMLGYFNWLPDEEYVFSLFQNEILKGDDSYSVYSYFNKILNQQSSNLSPLDRLLYLEIKTFLVDHNLNYTDKMSMAAGVEARVPYLDKELVEFAGKVPMNYKLRNGETKYILKKVAERYLPKGVIYRSKTGFGAPIRDWLRNDLKPMVNERLDRDFLSKQGIFDPDAIQEMIKKNDSGKFDFSYTIWSMLAIQSWLKQFKWSL